MHLLALYGRIITYFDRDTGTFSIWLGHDKYYYRDELRIFVRTAGTKSSSVLLLFIKNRQGSTFGLTHRIKSFNLFNAFCVWGECSQHLCSAQNNPMGNISNSAILLRRSDTRWIARDLLNHWRMSQCQLGSPFITFNRSSFARPPDRLYFR